MIARLSIAMGMVPSMVVQMSATDFDLLARFWDHEPWGPWRDNMHAALICRELRRPYLKDPRKPISLDQFMLHDPEEIEVARVVEQKKRVDNVFTFFRTVAKRVKKPKGETPRSKRRRVLQ